MIYIMFLGPLSLRLSPLRSGRVKAKVPRTLFPALAAAGYKEACSLNSPFRIVRLVKCRGSIKSRIQYLNLGPLNSYKPIKIRAN